MIFRIDIQHLLTHMIDHFTRNDFSNNFQFAIVSAKVRNGGRVSNVAKINELYPTPEIVESYAEYKDKKVLERMYFDMLKPDKDDNSKWQDNIIYKTFLNPLLSHHNIVIVCDEIENDYIDVLCKYLKKYFSVEVIDLNELFTKGHVGPLYIDIDEIHDKAVDIRLNSLRQENEQLASTSDGRMKLLRNMTKKQKIKKLKELGISISKEDMKDIDKILIDTWVEDDED